MENAVLDADQIKADLRAEFPGWSIILSRPYGRWWATRNPVPGERLYGDMVCDVSADTPDQLRELLQAAIATNTALADAAI